MTDPTTAQNYLLEEFKALRSEIDHHLKSVVAIQSSAVAGVGAIVVLADKNTISFFTTPGIVLLAALAALPHYVRTQTIGRYIAKIENEFLGEDGGWEHFIKKKERSRINRSPFLLFIGLGWAGLLVFAIATPLLKNWS